MLYFYLKLKVKSYVDYVVMLYELKKSKIMLLNQSYILFYLKVTI